MKHSYTVCLPCAVIDEAKAEGTEKLLDEKPLQIMLVENSITTIGDGGHVILDFGREIAGGIRILVHQAALTAQMRLRLGESVGECCAELGEKNSQNAHAYRDLTVPVISLSDSAFFDSGFRFLRIDVVGGEISLKSVVAEVLDSEVNIQGSFECSDPLLNDIYATAARTVELCVRRGVLWDGIKRDRLVWIGDIYPELLSLENLTDDLSPVVRSLDLVKDQTPADQWMNGIPMYSMWWMIILREYYRRTGDVRYLAAQKEYIDGLLRSIDAYVSEDGNTHFKSNLVDWPTHDTPDEPAGVHMIAVAAIDAAKEIMEYLGADATLCEKISKKLSAREFEVEEKKQIIALKDFALGNITDTEKEKLLTGGAKGMSTFMSYFLLSAIDRASDTSRALEIAKEYYGGMLKMGATTFWEDFDIDWMQEAAPLTRLPEEGEKDIHGDFGAYCYLGYRHSFCHGWSSGVLPYLVERVLGVKVENGGDTVRVSPSLGGLTWVKGDVPLKKGVLHIEIEDGKMKVKVPYGVKLICGRIIR
jgi:glycoside hydrolase family 78 protein